MRFAFVTLVLLCSCGAGRIPVPSSVSVSKVDAGIEVCTVVSADLRPIADGGTD